MRALVPSIVALSLAASQPVHAQFWGNVYVLLNGDTSAGPDHDTSFIKSYRDDLTLSFVSAFQGNVIEIAEKGGDGLRYETSTPVQFGFGLDYKWLTFELTFAAPGLSTTDPSQGPTEVNSLGFGYTGRRWWFRNFFQRSQGYYADDHRWVDPAWGEDEPPPYRGDLGSFTYMASLNHGFNAGQFSYNAAIWQLERQLRSAGSWIAGINFWYTEVDNIEGLIPDVELKRYAVPVDPTHVRRWSISLSGGYGYTVALWRHAFLNAIGIPGIGTQQQRLEGTDGRNAVSGWDIAGTAEFRIGMGYVADRWYAAFTANTYRNIGSLGEDLRLGSGFLTTRFAAGWRFRNIKPIIPALGL